MPRDFLNYLPQSVLDATSNNDFASTVQNALGSVQQAGASIMQPIGQQVASMLPEPPSMPSIPTMPEVPSFSLGSLEDWGFGSNKAPEAPPQAFSVGSPEDWGFGNKPPTGGSQPGTPTASASPSASQSVPSGVPSGGPTEFNAYVRQASAQRGLDPDQVLKVVGKEGPTGWGSVGTFNTGTSYGPLQLHYGGGTDPKQGMGDDFTKATGIDLRKVDPHTPEGIAAHQRAVDFALDRLSRTGDFREWYGADPALGSRMTKVNRITPVAPQASQQPAGQQPPMRGSEPAGAPAWGTYTAETLTPHQFREGQSQGLSADEAMAVCGPAAAVAFARANGRNPTLREAKELGSQMGVWDAGTGMHGPASQVQLLEKLGVPARLVQGADEGAMAREIQAGRPVTIDTPGHYYVATGYDPQTRTFEFGNSAGVLKSSKGRTRYRLDELAGLGMGAPRATIFMGAAR